VPDAGSRSSLADPLTSLGSGIYAARTFVALAALGDGDHPPEPLDGTAIWGSESATGWWSC
jgi:hypothetical protein